jgi:hypothetical protein
MIVFWWGGRVAAALAIVGTLVIMIDIIDMVRLEWRVTDHDS